MTLDELTAKVVAKLGEEGKKITAQYGPTVLLMAKADVDRWFAYVFVGREIDAYALYLKAAGNIDILAQWDEEGGKWKNANDGNATQLEMRNVIAQAACRAMLAVFIALVLG